jgi:hypothetical protein
MLNKVVSLRTIYIYILPSIFQHYEIERVSKGRRKGSRSYADNIYSLITILY